MPGTELQPLADASDVALVGGVADHLRHPRRDPADSFVLHAPLELAARTALLPRVAAHARDDARRRIVEIATAYDAFGPAVAEPARREPESASAAAVALAAAIDAGDLDEVDAAAVALARRTDAAEMRALLAPSVVPRLSAAAHAPIFLYQLPRVAPRGELPTELLRPLARELARQPEWRLGWIDRRVRRRRLGPEALRDAIAETPRLGIPGGEFIFPIMTQADRSGVAADLLAEPTASVELGAGRPIVLRAAAWSMLVEPPDYVPYGWTHCLTLPQAVLGIADVLDPRVALAVAATYVVGIRAAMAQRPLVEAPPPDPALELPAAIAAGPDVAAAAAWHTPVSRHDDVVTELVTRAAQHHDAHYVKYTLACLDVAAVDRDHTRLYLAAAAKLAGWWATA